jgi:copper(I)-binding protein
MNMKRVALMCLVVVLLGVVAVGLGGCAAKNPITVSNPRSNACKAGDNCGVFMTIADASTAGDTLLSASCDVAARTELHTVVADPKGGMMMSPVPNIPVPANGSVELKSGSLHVMLFTLNKELKAGDTFPMTLNFEKAGKQTVQVTCKPAN